MFICIRIKLDWAVPGETNCTGIVVTAHSWSLAYCLEIWEESTRICVNSPYKQRPCWSFVYSDWQSGVSMVKQSATSYLTQSENAPELCLKLKLFKEKPQLQIKFLCHCKHHRALLQTLTWHLCRGSKNCQSMGDLKTSSFGFSWKACFDFELVSISMKIAACWMEKLGSRGG